jgi:S1-C subfamily serine protease
VFRLIPDWLLYLIVVAAIVFVLFRAGQRADAPAPLPDAIESGAYLPPPSVYDPEVLVEVGPISSGIGTAFAISEEGWWLTSRHVVDGCSNVGLVIARGQAIPVSDVKRALFADLALLRTNRAPAALAIDTSERNFQIGQRAFHVGFPQAQPGEAYSRLIGREILVAHGRYESEEPVLVWAELGRTGGLRGSLSGISGGPTLAANGQVIGVTIAESARRGRIYSAAPSSIQRFLTVERVEADGEPAPRLTSDNYGPESDNLRRALAVAQVICVAPGDMPPT